VVFATAASFCPAVTAQGFTVLAAALDWLLAETEATFEERASMPLAEQSTWYLTDIFADSAAYAMVPDILRICERQRPDVIVRNDFEFGSCVAAELLGIPHAAFSLSPFMSPATLEPVIGGPLACLRSTHGLPPYPALDMLYPYLYLTIGPPSLQPHISPVIQALRTRPVEEAGGGTGCDPAVLGHDPAAATAGARLARHEVQSHPRPPADHRRGGRGPTSRRGGQHRP
jgi:hypothetical protein